MREPGACAYRLRAVGSCCFAQVTDLHLSLGSTAYGDQGDATFWFEDGALRERVVTTPNVLAALFEEIVRRSPEVDFVVATGDLTNAGLDEEFAAYREVVAAAPLPIISIPGNHDHHEAKPAADAGEPLPYERFLGPRWFSFDRDGVHFAAIDWYTHRLGIDTAVQDAWLAADLARVDDATPIVLLTHDQMPAAFYDALPRRPVASFSGHWHTTRVVEHAGTVHVNSGPATFGGLDYSPPHYRVATVSVPNGEVELRTVVRGSRDFDGATMRRSPTARFVAGSRWTAALGGAHLGGAERVSDDTIVVAGKSEDGPGGLVIALDVATGDLRWTQQLSAAVKATPRVVDGAVVAASVAGEVVCVDAPTGALRWRTWLHADPLHLWCYARPVVHDGLVHVGDVGRFAAIDFADGRIHWSRDDLGHRENLTTIPSPVIAGGVLVGAFIGQAPAMFAIDPTTGTTAWPAGDVHGIYEAGADLATELSRAVVGGITADPEGDDVHVVRLGSRVERVRAADGEVVWSAPFHGWFNPAPPVVHGDAVIATAATGQVWAYDRATGARRWSTVVSTDGAPAMGSYRSDGASLLAPVTPIGGSALPTDLGRRHRRARRRLRWRDEVDRDRCRRRRAAAECRLDPHRRRRRRVGARPVGRLIRRSGHQPTQGAARAAVAPPRCSSASSSRCRGSRCSGPATGCRDRHPRWSGPFAT